MATKRTPLARPALARITPELLSLYRNIQSDHDREHFHRLIGHKPWEASPLDTDTAEPPQWARARGGPWADSWGRAWEMRQALESAARSRG